MKINEYPLWTAVITPMDDDGNVDYTDLTNILKAQDQAKNGLLILGSTGEALNLDIDESKKILDHTLSLDLESPIMVGVGGINLKETKKWINYLETLKVDAYLLVTPLYAKPGTQGQYNWFKELMDLSTRPCMLYNVPSRTGIKMCFEAVSMLKDHKHFWAIKEASGSTEDFAKYVSAAPDARVYSGDDALLADFVPLGCKGLVSVASNVWPAQTHKYVDMALDKSLIEKNLWIDSANSLFIASNPIPVKALMAHDSQISTPVLREPLTHTDLESLNELKESNSKINEWYNSVK